ncbi:hypothetical protein NKH77_48500 [Streptomyces sp. M19]
MALSNRARRSVMVAPAYADQVSPVADRLSRPAEAHRPTAPCQDLTRRRPAGADGSGSRARRSRLRERRAPSHRNRPPATSTHSQLAAISL